MGTNRILVLLSLSGLAASLLLILAPVPPATAFSLESQGENVTPGQMLRAMHQYGLPKIMLRERQSPGPGYHYRIVFGSNHYIIMGSADTALYVYWRAAQETIGVIQRGY